MIFSAKNEEGIPTWKLVLTDEKTVTRRLKPEPVGAIRAVQPGRGKKAVCKIRILSCSTQKEWMEKLCDKNVHEMAQKIKRRKKRPDLCEFFGELFTNLWHKLDEEAEKEGFNRIIPLLTWFINNKIDYLKTYRIEFERIKNGLQNHR